MDECGPWLAAKKPRGGGEGEAAGGSATAAWTEIIVGEFHFEEGELAHHKLQTILTDAA